MDKKIICFGEMLWDVFPSESIAGGAPMNAALHLQHLGIHTSMISSIGNDEEGKKLLEFVKTYGLHVHLIQTDTQHSTGKVLVDDSDRENILYDIVSPAAWDQIMWSEEIQSHVDHADAFVFGSLSARSPKSQETLLKILESNTLKIGDINLRPPFYNQEVIEKLLYKTNVLKINEEELTIIGGYFTKKEDPEAVLEDLTGMFDLDLICVTLGAKGAWIYQEGEIIKHPGYPVNVQDTVGSGDAFLSGFIYSYLNGISVEKTLDFACALGALVATHQGGTPKYTMEDIEKTKAKE